MGIKRQNGGPYVCPKYEKIGQGMEEKVAKRLALLLKKERERELKLKREESRRQRELEELMQAMKEQQIDSEMRLKKEKGTQRKGGKRENAVRDGTGGTETEGEARDGTETSRA
ncbi:hypothetical protein BaRGS_00018069 [Batillaria attramentaria]|uniref:Uncharacterized protein n=1 Tax=Batillaria attramentaria TaxID=370345 RepID=A0ABD0KTY4_9CAEN